MKLAVVKLGCPKNDVDLEEILGRLPASVETVDNLAVADAVLIHTCAFIESAKRESIEAILEASQAQTANPDGSRRKIYVSGCLPQRYDGEIQALFPEVTAFFPHRSPQKVATELGQCLDLPLSPGSERKLLNPPHYAYLTIADGCDNRCSYCAIPLIKGKFVSRPWEQVLTEARQRIRAGAQELIIIAQDSTRYGSDLAPEFSLTRLLHRLAEIPGVRWLRLMYAHPAHWTRDLTEAMKSLAQVCKYVDLPIQHISDKILKSMGRFVSQSDIKRLVQELRTEIPELALRTTVMVGYPGETDKEFQELLNYVNEARFERLGVFTYSKEEGTRAFAHRDRIPERIKQERRDLIMQAQAEIVGEKNDAMINKRIAVVIDRYDVEQNRFIGRSQWDAPEIDNTVLISEPVDVGKFYEVLIVDHDLYDLIATPLKPILSSMG